MMERGFVSPARAAAILGVHRNTVYAWALNAIEGRRSRLNHVERHPITGYLSIAMADVETIKRASKNEDDEE